MTDRDPTIEQRYKQACDDLHPECKPLPRDNRPRLGRLIMENQDLLASRNRWRSLAICLLSVLIFACVMLAAEMVRGEDSLNDSLRAAARHSTEYHGTPLYISLYDIPADKRPLMLDGIAFAAHHLSHSGVPIKPVRVSPECVMLPSELYDPFNKGWLSAWSKIYDPRYSAIAYNYQFSGEILSVESVVIRGDRCSFSCRGKFYADAPAAKLVKATHREYPSWLDAGAARLLYEQTGYDMVSAAEFVAQACVAPLYYEFTAAPKTVAEFLGVKSHSAFGLDGARGANIDYSQVTFTQRGTESYEDKHLSFDVDKSILLTPDRDVFALPDRTNSVDAYEGIELKSGGQFHSSIYGGNQQQVANGIVPGQIALDWSHGNRVIFVGLGCWSCHFSKKGNTEQAGYIEHEHSNGIPASKDKVKAAHLGSYFGDQARRHREGLRNREDWYEASKIACDGAEPSDCVAALNWLFDAVTQTPVTPRRACEQLCLTVDADSTPEETLTRWLAGVSSDALGQLSKGEAVNPQRFRQALPLALSHISYAKRFAK